MFSEKSNSLPILATEESNVVENFPPLGPEVKVLIVWPRFPKCYWGMEDALAIAGVSVYMAPLAMITVASLLPARWRVRLLDRAFQDLRDEDILEADLVMVSAMHAQRNDALTVLSQCRRLKRRTVIGGPWAAIEPEVLLDLADHVVVGEVEESMAQIAADFEAGRARRMYRIAEKPDLSRSPAPRFDLLDLRRYATMTVQFSRGCPFQCEFCDIPTIYGRRPRTKAAGQVVAELESLYQLGWRGWVFFCEDNFNGNHHVALEITRAIARWQESRNFPFVFCTQASIDLAERSELVDAMVEANFVAVFIGIESPSAEALLETRKHQNLRCDTLEQVRFLQSRGLWISAGFIVGFDADDEGIFRRQLEFIEDAAIPLAMINLLQAPPSTPLYSRLQGEGRLLDNDVDYIGARAFPNFRTALPRDVLFQGTASLLRDLYEPEQFFRRAARMLERWAAVQRIPKTAIFFALRAILRSVWIQGIRSDYRGAYWRFVARIIRRCGTNPAKLWIAVGLLPGAHHLFGYTREMIESLEKECRTPAPSEDSAGRDPVLQSVDAAPISFSEVAAAASAGPDRSTVHIARRSVCAEGAPRSA
jgi:radical SAM superfamily enzyme YgiQ (UPF0313 family)